MGKSKKKKGQTSGEKPQKRERCISCSSYVKDRATRGQACPVCDRLFCAPCASHFISCDGGNCEEEPRCSDCAFSYSGTRERLEEERRKRKERGEPVDQKFVEKLMPMMLCDNCGECLCCRCFHWQTKGQEGHNMCDKCLKNLCYKCNIKEGHGVADVTFCSAGCVKTYCNSCEPNFSFDFEKKIMVCSSCSSKKMQVPRQEINLAGEGQNDNSSISKDQRRRNESVDGLRSAEEEDLRVEEGRRKVRDKVSRKEKEDELKKAQKTETRPSCAMKSCKHPSKTVIPPCSNPECNTGEGGLLKCSGCRSALYCSSGCQIVMWPEHKRECKQMKARRKVKKGRKRG